MEAIIPDKLYFKIGEVSGFTSLKPSVMRYWETEFTFLRPLKSRSGQRLYTREHIELLAELKRLLYEEKLTIEGARKRIGPNGRTVGQPVPPPPNVQKNRFKIIEEVRRDLVKLRDSL